MRSMHEVRNKTRKSVVADKPRDAFVPVMLTRTGYARTRTKPTRTRTRLARTRT